MKPRLRNFSRFTLVGLLFYGLSVVLNGLLIDFLAWPTLVTSTAVLVVLFLLKFWLSVRWRIIRNRFGPYLAGNVLLSLLAPVLVWLAVDFAGLPASLSTAGILALVFMLRYLLLGALGLLATENPSTRRPGSEQQP
ncbi:MAG: hypothetical protein ACFE0O_09210 [Opitutales bacterium]